MICTCEPDTLKERNGHSASCNRYNRKLETDTRKQANKKASLKQVKKVSDKMAIELKIYEKKKKAHLKAHPDCQVKLVGCTNQNNVVHHSEKRGKNLNNEATFLTACDHCHKQIHFVLSGKENREKGLLKTI